MRHAFKIPESFYLFGQKISVVAKESIESEDGNYGYAKFCKQIIEIQKPMAGVTMTEQRQEQVFCHELMHWLFHMAEKPKLASDEELVNMMGNLLHQFMTTAEYGKER